MKTIIFGTNDLAELSKFYLETDSDYFPCAFCVDGDFLRETKFNDLPVLPFEDILTLDPSEHLFFVPLYDNKLREKKLKQVHGKGYATISYVSSRATVLSPIGDNCLVMENNVIQPFVKVGDNTIFWSGNHIGHHSVLEGSSFFSSHVVVSGHCLVKKYTWFGVNSSVKDHVEVAEGTLVGMGSVILNDTKPYRKYVGVPGRDVGESNV